MQLPGGQFVAVAVGRLLAASSFDVVADFGAVVVAVGVAAADAAAAAALCLLSPVPTVTQTSVVAV